MPMSPARILKIVLVIAGIVLALYFFVIATAPKTILPPLPNPNGYDDFVRAGQMLKNTATTNDYRNWSHDELAAFVATNAEAFALAQTGLTRECMAPDMFTTNVVFSGLARSKAITLAVTAEGWLAKSENRTNDSVQFFMDATTLGTKQSRGGVIITKLVGIACESIGREALRSWIDKLDAQKCREVSLFLAKLDASDEPAEITLANEKNWVRTHYSLMDRFKALVTYKQQRDVQNKAKAKFQQNTFRRRQTIIDFAERAYELEQGHRSAKLEDLVPNYLKELPSTSISGTNVTYHL